VARCWAGFASFGAGLVHVAVVQEHLAEAWYHGTFFAVIGLAQVGWALWALSGTSVPRPRATAAATLALIALWAVSRTIGLSLDPVTAVPEPVGRADLLAVVLELGLILCIIAALGLRPASTSGVRTERAGSPTASSARFVALLAAGALAVSAIATPAMAATTAGEHAHEHGHSH